MGKIRVAVLGDDELEKQLKKRAEKRRLVKKEKKQDDEKSIASEEKITPPPMAEEAHVVQTDQDTAKTKTSKPRAHKVKQRSRKYQEVAKMINQNTYYDLVDAVSLVKKTSISSFDGTVEAHINLVREKGKDVPDLRGTVRFPYTTGKTVRVALADEEIIAKVEQGNIDFDVLIARPQMMPKLAKVARILGPRGLMPNPKNGTVTDKPEEKAKELTSGTTHFKSESGQPIIHMRIGKVSQNDKEIIANIQALILAIGKPKIAKVTLASTMGPGVRVKHDLL